MLFCVMVAPATKSLAAGVPRSHKKADSSRPALNLQSFFGPAGLRRRVSTFRARETIFSQGDPAKRVLYIQDGGVKISVVNEAGKEAVVAILGPGDFLGEGCLAGQSICIATATAIAPTTAYVLEKDEVIRALHEEHEFSDRFVSFMLARNLRTEENLIDLLFNSSEKRLARTLLLLARYGASRRSQKLLPRVSQEMLAGMIGTTRSRVNFFMNKFRKLGFLEYSSGKIRINNSLLSVVLHD